MRLLYFSHFILEFTKRTGMNGKITLTRFTIYAGGRRVTSFSSDMGDFP